MMPSFFASLVLLLRIFRVGLASPVTCESSGVSASTTTTTSTTTFTTTSCSSSSSSSSPSSPASDLSTMSPVTVFTCLCPELVTTSISTPYGNSTTSPVSTIAPFSNTTAGSNGTFVFPNATMTISIPPSGPEPTPNPPSNSAAAQLLRTVRDKILLDYTTYGTISCFKEGSTLDCGGSWLFGADWNNNTLNNQLFANTVNDSLFMCSSDSTYLQPKNLDRVFYGFTATNITDSLARVAHATSVYAAGICSLNQTCAQIYNNATEQMYSDFQFYINSTFFTYMQSSLPQNDSQSFCPNSISGTASVFYSAISYFDASKEYFGIHNSAFLPSVAQAINGTVQEARLELGLMLANNARMFEGVWLNMIFFSYDPNNVVTTRSLGDDEIYPGCPRRQYVISGPCPGVIPPREYDMASTILPMKDRDMMERFGNSTTAPTSTALAIRQDSSCASAIAAIESKQSDLKKARGLLDSALALVGEVPFAEAEILALSPELAVAACDKFNTCDGLPQGLIDMGNVFLQAAASVKAKDVIDKLVEKGVEEFESVVEDNVPKAKLVGALFDGVDKNYQLAAMCCSVSCDSAICQQASMGCSLSWGDFWGGGLLNCGLT